MFGEVDERRAAGKNQRVDLFGGHQLSGALDAHAPLLARNRPRLIPHRGERGDGGREGRCPVTSTRAVEDGLPVNLRTM